MRMKWILFLTLASSSLFAMAQPEPPYKKNPTLPAFEMRKTDSTLFTQANLKKQQTLLMYFSPDCDHCIKQMEEMNKRMKDLAKLQIVIITNQTMEQLAGFVKKYKLTKYSNISAGVETKFALPAFFRMQSLPYFALYDKNGKLITTYESNTKVDTLLNAFNRL